MQSTKSKIAIIKKSDKEGQKALAVAAINAIQESCKPFYFAKHWK